MPPPDSSSKERPQLVAHAVPGFDEETGRLIWALEEARARTLKELQAVPAAVLHEQPT